MSIQRRDDPGKGVPPLNAALLARLRRAVRKPRRVGARRGETAAQRPPEHA